MSRLSHCAVVVVPAFLLCTLASADTLLVGFNTQTPVQDYSTSGIYQQDFGPSGASAGIEENGLLYVIQPNTDTFSSSTITAYNSAQQSVASFTVPYLIGDGAPGANNTLWLAGYNGTVYQLTTSGSLLSSFDTGYSSATSIGIASDGTNLFTTEGDASDGIDERNTSGAVVATVHTGYTSLYGLAWDSSNSTFYAGSFDSIYALNLNFGNMTANLLGTMSIAGDSRTPNGALHDGLEAVDLSSLAGPAPPPPPTVPEPRFGWLTGMILLIGGACFGARGYRRLAALGASVLVVAAIAAQPASAAVTANLNMTASSIPIGDTDTFTASASDTSNPGATFTYQFNVKVSSAGSYSMLKDFYKTNTFNWTPISHEGTYDVQVVVRSSAGGSASAAQTVSVTSRVTGSSPVVNSTANTLVALYSAPPCVAPKQVRVRFHAQGETTWQMTPSETCNGFSLNFYVAGMRAATTYVLQQDTLNGPFDTPGPQLNFRTGNVPSSFNTYSPFVIDPAKPPTNTSYPIELHCTAESFATDVQDRVVWYLPLNAGSGYMTRAVPGGTFLVIMDDQPGDHKYFREVDLAGNIVRETNWTILNQEVNAYRTAHHQSPSTVTLNFISHEGHRLANGYTLVLVSEERVANQGQGNVDVLGDIALVLDTNFQVVWAWDSFDWLSVTRKALLNNVCVARPGCPVNYFNKQTNGQTYTTANDWTHENSIAQDPSDGNLIISVRHQAWIVKVNYANGSGDGHIIWKLGNQGNFSLSSGTPSSEWFNYQHDAEFQANGLLTLFNNNNLETGGVDSRGQAWSLDQTHLVATPVINYDLGVQSFAVGSAQLLSNGNYWFGAGDVNSNETQTSEITPSGTLVFRDQDGQTTYRAFRMRSMYQQ